jgi:hypothetical protein
MIYSFLSNGAAEVVRWRFCQILVQLFIDQIPILQVNRLGAAAQKYQASAQNASSNSSSPDLESNCNM